MCSFCGFTVRRTAVALSPAGPSRRPETRRRKITTPRADVSGLLTTAPSSRLTCSTTPTLTAVLQTGFTTCKQRISSGSRTHVRSYLRRIRGSSSTMPSFRGTARAHVGSCNRSQKCWDHRVCDVNAERSRRQRGRRQAVGPSQMKYIKGPGDSCTSRVLISSA